MNTKTHLNTTGILLLVASLFCLPAAAQDIASAEKVTVKEGVTHAQKDGEWISLDKELELATAIKVQTNGTFTVDGGKPRPLKEGQILRNDGYLVNGDGTMAPVYDRLTVERIGEVTLHQDGASRQLTQPYKLPNGAQVMPDGTMITPQGKLNRLVPGQMFKLSGDALLAKDSVTMQGGTVYVQKEGKRYKIEPNRMLIMNDGTKVYGTGKVVKMDGSQQMLQEGDIITVPGVRVN